MYHSSTSNQCQWPRGHPEGAQQPQKLGFPHILNLSAKDLCFISMGKSNLKNVHLQTFPHVAIATNEKYRCDFAACTNCFWILSSIFVKIFLFHVWNESNIGWSKIENGDISCQIFFGKVFLMFQSFLVGIITYLDRQNHLRMIAESRALIWRKFYPILLRINLFSSWRSGLWTFV